MAVSEKLPYGRRNRPCSFGSGKFLNQPHLVLSIRLAVGVKHFMMPRIWLAKDRHLPSVPGILCLRLTVDQPPTNGANALFFQNRQDRLERTAVAAGHEFCADERPAVLTKL